jgi:hypothetical protein
MMLFISSNAVVIPVQTAKENEDDDEEVKFLKFVKKCAQKDDPLPAGKEKLFDGIVNSNGQIDEKKRWAFLRLNWNRNI